jgi:hypothetical protein
MAVPVTRLAAIIKKKKNGMEAEKKGFGKKEQKEIARCL